MIEGVDISSWQGENIDWLAVAQAGKRFAIIRSGDGWYLDPRFESNLQGAADVGLHTEVYHYLRFDAPPSELAGLCARRFESAQRYGAKRLWLDWEDTSAHSKGMTPLQRKAWLVVFLEALGDVPQGHYTGTWWWNPYMDSWDRLKDEKMWIGQYPLWNSCRSDPTAAGLAPTLPDSWTDWLIWQYTSQGTCPGIDGPVDLNVAQDVLLEEEMPTNHEERIAVLEEKLAHEQDKSQRTELLLGWHAAMGTGVEAARFWLFIKEGGIEWRLKGNGWVAPD